MIVWTGFGYLVAVITLTVSVVMNFLLDGYFGKGFCASHGWLLGAALFIGGIQSAIVGFALNTSDDCAVVDNRTGEPLASTQSRHTFFYVPMHWAGLIVAAVGVVVIVKRVLS